MNITLVFDTYEEMAAFAGKIAGGGSGITAVPVRTAEKKTAAVLAVEEEKPAVKEEEEAPFEEDRPTIQDVRAVLAEKKKQGKDIKALLASFGAEKLSQVKEEDYAALLKKAGEL